MPNKDETQARLGTPEARLRIYIEQLQQDRARLRETVDHLRLELAVHQQLLTELQRQLVTPEIPLAQNQTEEAPATQ